MQKYEPHDYQKYCIRRMVGEPKLGLFLDMGLGKTSIALTAVNDLKYNRFAISKALVIAPKKVAEDTWTREADKWEHLALLRVIRALGTEAQRIRALSSPGDVYVINRENIPWLVDHYRNSWPFDCLIVDESTSFKSHQAKRFKALKSILPHITRCVILTGTPTPKGMIDLWSQVYLLDSGERLGKSISQYRTRFFAPDKRDRTTIFSYAPLPGAEEGILSKISDICVSLRAKDYLKMPERIDDVKYIRLDSKAEKAYKKLEKEMLLEIDENSIDAGTAAVLSNKLQQLCNGAAYDENGKAVEIHSCKLEAFMEMVEALEGNSMLVFYNFQHDRDRIKRELTKTKLVVGELKSEKDISAWNNGEIDILLAHPASAAYGLNLQDGGNHIIWFGLNWSLELYQQANARLHRQGQRNTVIVHHLVIDGGRDQDIMAALEEKGATQDLILDSLKARIRDAHRSN